MKFSEYLASQITPQMTLLEKFNAMCKFLEKHEKGFGTKLYFHTIRFEGSANIIYLINTDSNPMTDINVQSMYSIWRKSVSMKFNDYQILYLTLNQQGKVSITISSGTYSLASYVVSSDTVIEL